MRVPLAWLRDYVDLHDADTVIAGLAGLGFPVDAVDRRPPISGVVVGRITALAKHPNADKLQLCTIDVGGARTLTIATAATNVAAGQTIPVATIGAKLPHLTIEPRKMRGIDSEGMLCSAEELALEADWFEDGIMQLDAGMPLGADVVECFRLDDPVLDVDVTPNRADALSMLGLARELAAAFGRTLREPATTSALAGPATDLRVTIETVDCRRYVAQRVGGLTVRPAPVWMRVRLALAGQRPINNLVDISNFVMLEIGQPLHFFDHAKIAGRHIVVRDPEPDERLTTLDGVDRALDATALLIADDAQATGLAGLMGGRISEVGPDTREIAIESANWSGPRIRRMSVALGLRTEASTRNEKHLPLALADIGAARAAHLLVAEGGTAYAPVGYGEQPAPHAPIVLPKDLVVRLLGFELDDDATASALRSLGFAVDDAGTAFAVTPPAWRSDVTIAADLVEEVARVVGYDRLESAMPAIEAQPLGSAAFDRETAVATVLAGLGYRECLTLGLQSAATAARDRALGIAVPPVVEIRNPLSDEQRFLRYSLLHAQLALVARDRAPRPYRTFEIGHVFREADPVPVERNVVTFVAATPRADEPGWRSTPFLALKSDVLALVRAVTGAHADVAPPPEPAGGLHPGKQAAVLLRRDGAAVRIGTLGVVDPRLLRAFEIADDVVACELELDLLAAGASRHAPFVAPSRFPPVERDLAILLDAAVPAGDVLALVSGCEGVRDATAFDEYRGPQIGPDKKSLAIRVVLQRDDATLTDEIAEGLLARVVELLRERLGATLRG